MVQHKLCVNCAALRELFLKKYILFYVLIDMGGFKICCIQISASMNLIFHSTPIFIQPWHILEGDSSFPSEYGAEFPLCTLP